MDRNAFYFDLPPELIAQKPVEPRDAAKLFLLHRPSGERSLRRVSDLPEFVRPGDVVVVNNTKVIPSVLRGERAYGGQIQVKLVSRKQPCIWDCLIDSIRPSASGERLVFGGGAIVGTVIGPNASHTGHLISFEARGGDILSTLETVGAYFHPLHLPPVNGDASILQTVYASRPGSFQSPSAGLHLTDRLLDALHSAGAINVEITQHVGRLDSPDLLVGHNPLKSQHLYEEWFDVSPEAAASINAAKERGNRVFAIGTTVTRTLESVGRTGRVDPGQGWTKLFIRPGFRFKIVDALLSNFQSPMISTLILACAFGGTDLVMEHYRQAVAMGLRFLEYGDAALYL